MRSPLLILLSVAACAPRASGDRAASDASSAPLYVFYAIHVHISGGDYLPYDDKLAAANPTLRAASVLDETAAQNMISGVEAIADVAEAHGAKITWEPTYGSAKGFCDYDGATSSNVYKDLLAKGHEVGVHAHEYIDLETTVGYLADSCGVTATANSGFMVQVQKSSDPQADMAKALQTGADAGLVAATENLSPNGEKNPFADPSLCGTSFGIDNDMYETTGNLLYPWRPDVDGEDVCNHDPEGAVVMVDHVQPDWMIPEGETAPQNPLGDEAFGQLQAFYNATVAYRAANPNDRVAAWGFVTHITEYGVTATTAAEASALDELDAFLDRVDTDVAAGTVAYATASEIAAKF